MVRYRSSDILNRVVVLRGRGLLQCEIAQILGMSQGAVSKVLKRNRVLGTPVPRPRPGRYRKTTRRDDRLLLRLCRRNRWNNSTQLRQEWVRATGRPVTTSTVRKRLVRAGYRARRPARCPALTERHRLHRRQWAQRHRNWALGHWRHVVFADESRFTLHGNDGRLSVRRMAGERLTLVWHPTMAHVDLASWCGVLYTMVRNHLSSSSMGTFARTDILTFCETHCSHLPGKLSETTLYSCTIMHPRTFPTEPELSW